MEKHFSWIRLCLVALLQVSSLVRVAEAQPPVNITWTGCGPLGNEGQRLSVGSRMVFCIQLGNNLNWAAGVQYIRLSFQPRVDEYSRFTVPNSFSDFTAGNALSNPFIGRNITVGVASMQQVSFLRQYFDFISGKVYPHLTAIIDVDGGRVKGITWDDACVFCGRGECDEITYNYNGLQQTQRSSGQPSRGCFVPQTECANGDGKCDLTVYVVWTGSDRNGKAMQSSASRFSAFPTQEIADRFAKNLPRPPKLPDLPDFPNLPGTGQNNDGARSRDL